MGLTDRVASSVGDAAVWLYLAVAFVVLPVFVPLAVKAVEPDGMRRRFMTGCGALGAVVSLIYVAAMIAKPIGAVIDGYTVVYSIHLGESGTVNGLYVVAICGALIASSHRRIVVFGVVNIAAVGVLLWVGSHANTSLWCLWAAIASVAIVAHLRLAHRSHERVQPLPHQLA